MSEAANEKLNQFSSIPLYTQLKEIFLKNISTGRWKPGDKIPIQQELADTYGVSLAVVRQAVQILVNKGILIKRQGKGTYVLDRRITQGPKKLTSLTQELVAKGLRPGAKVIEAFMVTADEKLSSVFSVPLNADIVKIKRLRTVNNEPIGIQTFFCPSNIAPKMLENDLTGSLYDLLKDKYSTRITNAIEKYTAIILPPESCAILEVEYPFAGFFVERFGYNEMGITIEYTRSLIRSDKYVVEIDLTK